MKIASRIVELTTINQRSVLSIIRELVEILLQEIHVGVNFNIAL